jgi:hypothetical protein
MALPPRRSRDCCRRWAGRGGEEARARPETRGETSPETRGETGSETNETQSGEVNRPRIHNTDGQDARSAHDSQRNGSSSVVHAELDSASPPRGDETLKQVQGDQALTIRELSLLNLVPRPT